MLQCSTSVKFLISVRGRWRLAQESLSRPARAAVFLVARSDLESPIDPGVGVPGRGGGKPEVPHVRRKTANSARKPV